VRAAPDNPKLFDGVLLQNAVAFAAAADAYAKVDGLREWFVLYFLMGQGIELALKAFAVNKGATDRQLKTIGHNLAEALRCAEDAGFGTVAPITDTERATIELLSKWHSEQVTRYPLSRVMRFLGRRSFARFSTKL
jgi:hypothetical protein